MGAFRTSRATGKASLVLAVAVATLWMQTATPVMSEECYYWLYGVHLDWSYFDHPGMIGWAIRLGCELLGDNALGLRMVAGLAWCLTTWVGLRWLRELGGDGACEKLWLVLTLGVPLFAAGHLMATPDAPLTAFYCLAAHELWRLSRSPARWRLALAGALAGLALESKYTAAFLFLGFALQLALDPALRARLGLADLALLGGSAAAAFAPTLLWNAAHGWESFLFQTGERAEAARLSFESPVRFAATQLLLVSPLLIWVGVRSSSWALRRARSGDARFTALVAYGLPLPLFLLACSLVVSVKDHWAFPAYVPLALLGVLWWKAEGRARMGPFARRLGVSWIACSWVVCLALPLARWAPQPGGTHWDPEHEIGDHAVALARTLDPDGGRVFLFAVNHRDSAELAWEQRSAEGRLRLPVLAQDVRGRPARQFEHWIDPQQVVGWDGIFALEGIQERPRKLEEVRERFDSVELADAVDLTLGGRVLRRVRLFACRNYLGPRGRDLRVADEPRASP